MPLSLPRFRALWKQEEETSRSKDKPHLPLTQQGLSYWSHYVSVTPHIASLKREIDPPEVHPPIKNDLVAEILSRWKERGASHLP